MAASQQVNAYLNAHYDGMSPEQLILMLYNGALSRLKLVKEGIKEGDMKKKGENLSKVIAIVSELHACVDSSMEDESTQFLIGLYQAILGELPKVSINNDLKTVDLTMDYIGELKRIWETTVMGKTAEAEKPAEPRLKAVPPKPAAAAKPQARPMNNVYSNTPQQAFRAISV